AIHLVGAGLSRVEIRPDYTRQHDENARDGNEGEAHEIVGGPATSSIYRHEPTHEPEPLAVARVLRWEPVEEPDLLARPTFPEPICVPRQRQVLERVPGVRALE